MAYAVNRSFGLEWAVLWAAHFTPLGEKAPHSLEIELGAAVPGT